MRRGLALALVAGVLGAGTTFGAGTAAADPSHSRAHRPPGKQSTSGHPAPDGDTAEDPDAQQLQHLKNLSGDPSRRKELYDLIRNSAHY